MNQQLQPRSLAALATQASHDPGADRTRQQQQQCSPADSAASHAAGTPSASVDAAAVLGDSTLTSGQEAAPMNAEIPEQLLAGEHSSEHLQLWRLAQPLLRQVVGNLRPRNLADVPLTEIVVKVQPGDHVAVLGDGDTAWHHGIVFSVPSAATPDTRFQVVDMSPDANVRVRSFASFAPLKSTAVVGVVRYAGDDPDIRGLSLARATYLLNNPELAPVVYHLLLRNCQHFATWCRTGRWESEQIMAVVAVVAEILARVVTVNLDSLASKLLK